MTQDKDLLKVRSMLAALSSDAPAAFESVSSENKWIGPGPIHEGKTEVTQEKGLHPFDLKYDEFGGSGYRRADSPIGLLFLGINRSLTKDLVSECIANENRPKLEGEQ